MLYENAQAESLRNLPTSNKVYQVDDMGKIRRGGYIIIWWKGDHEPKHVHIRTGNGRKLGRVNLATMKGMEGWTPSQKLVVILEELKKEGHV